MPSFHPASLPTGHHWAAVRARTILAACRDVLMQLTEHPAGGSAPAGADGSGPAVALHGLVELDGVPHLVSAAGSRPPTGAVTLRCTASSQDRFQDRFQDLSQHLGTLVLKGRCGRPLPDAAVAGLAALRGSRSCVLPEAGALARAEAWDGGVTVFPILLEEVRIEVGTPAPDGTRPAFFVPLDLFHRASPDLWWAHGGTIAAHLERHHQAELRALVAMTGGVRGASGVVVRDIGPHGMVLTCLTLDGVADQVIPFDPPLEEPAQLGTWFRPSPSP